MKPIKETLDTNQKLQLPNEETAKFFLKLGDYFNLFETTDLNYKD
jgi:hypothetical protein